MPPHTEQEDTEVLLRRPAGRIVQALLDANAQYKKLARCYEENDAGREARLQALLKMDALFKHLQKRCDSETRDNGAADLERK